jgi:cell wall-associated NlpC family hydrolase
VAAALVAGAGAGIGSVTAGADPVPHSNSSSELQHYKELATKTEKVQEAYLTAQHDLKQKRHELHAANAKLATAHKHGKQAEQKVAAERSRVDELSAASLEGAQLSKLSTLLGGQSAHDLVQRHEAMGWLASSNQRMLNEMTRASRQAQHAKQEAAHAQRRATAAEDAAVTLRDSLAKRKKVLSGKIAKAKEALEKLSAPAKKKLSEPGDQGTFVPAHEAAQDAGSSEKDTFVGPAGTAGDVIKAALAKRGDPYRWGADGPGAFDCSGLVQYAYAKAGISMPHSSAAQYQRGTPVARGAWKPGDLLFYGSGPSAIHHVAIYVGNGEVVHAPNAGEPVKVVPAPNGAGSDYYGAKRIVH